MIRINSGRAFSGTTVQPEQPTLVNPQSNSALPPPRPLSTFVARAPTIRRSTMLSDDMELQGDVKSLPSLPRESASLSSYHEDVEGQGFRNSDGYLAAPPGNLDSFNSDKGFPSSKRFTSTSWVSNDATQYRQGSGQPPIRLQPVRGPGREEEYRMYPIDSASTYHYKAGGYAI